MMMVFLAFDKHHACFHNSLAPTIGNEDIVPSHPFSLLSIFNSTLHRNFVSLSHNNKDLAEVIKDLVHIPLFLFSSLEETEK